MAFFDHVYAVVEAATADEMARCEYLRGFARFEVQSAVADGETWTGRYLSGRGTYVEVFGPGDVEGPEGRIGATGIGLSTREPPGLEFISDRMKEVGAEGEVRRRTRAEGDEQVAWFDYLLPAGSPEASSAWVMEYLADPTDRQRRESSYLDWIAQREDEHRQRPGPFVREVCSVELGAPAKDIAIGEPLWRAAGYVVTQSADVLVVSDPETRFRLHTTTEDAAGLRRIEFALTAEAPDAHVERIGRSTLTVGPGDRATWDFLSR